MQEFEQHQRRLSTALLRIGAAFERLGEPPPAAQVLARAQDNGDLFSEIEIARLTRLAEEARAEAAALSEQLVGTHATLEEVVLELSAQIEARDLELSQLRAAEAALAQPDAAAEAAVAAELAALQEAIELLNAEIAARDARIAELRRREAAAAQPDPEAEAALAKAQAEVADLTARLAALSEQHRDATATLEEVVLSLNGQIEARDGEIAKLRADLEAAPAADELEALQQAIELLNGEVAARDEQIAALRSLQAAAPQPDPEAEAALASAKGEIADLTARFAALSERHSGSTATLEEVVLALTGQIEARDGEIATLRAALETASAEAASAASLADPDEIARLKAVVADGEGHAAELAEQLAILSSRHAETTTTRDERLAALNAQVEAQAAEMARMRNVNIQLREAMRTMREGMATGGVDATAINRALEAEVAALSSAREFERTELDALLAALDPLLAPAPATDAPEVVNA